MNSGEHLPEPPQRVEMDKFPHDCAGCVIAWNTRDRVWYLKRWNESCPEHVYLRDLAGREGNRTGHDTSGTCDDSSESPQGSSDDAALPSRGL